MENITRAAFNALSQNERHKFMKAGGVVTDPQPAPALQIADPNLLTRQEFAALPPVEQMAAVRAGRRVVDGERAG